MTFYVARRWDFGRKFPAKSGLWARETAELCGNSVFFQLTLMAFVSVFAFALPLNDKNEMEEIDVKLSFIEH